MGGGLFTKSDDENTYDSFSVLLPHILQIRHTFLKSNAKIPHNFIPNHIKIKKTHK